MDNYLNYNLELNLDPEETDHLSDSSSIQTPLRPDAFEMTDEEKIERIATHFRAIMHTLGLDLTDDSLQGTPHRVAKMYVNEVFRGLNPDNKPHAKLFENRYAYNQMLVERDITIYSYCEHHFVPIIGKAHVAYIPDKNVVGLSKLNRIVQYFAKRPQVQERLTMQIADELKQVLRTQNVAVYIEADHLCVMSRGVNDVGSSTITTEFSGLFREDKYRQEFLQYVHK
ncbi:MAG: GTP cyclohydrolase I type 1 [uncultured Adhaeribacter sp.]|uniref:GTP cyclohydrolase 1 n=1 Tax=uncultured Adhaeribacter sp. TaxID=448109 RepID=A0A6J4ICA2_9BACT|nr:MAG: GTP cyclohydrolase I type 1 [uncultured Adhaeribacter sp.]